MTYKPKYLRERSKDIINARNWGIGIITALLGIGMFISEVRRILELQLHLIDYLYLSLYLISLALIGLWIWATQKELDLLFEWLDPQRYIPPSSFKETIIIIFLGILLSALLFSARNIFIYGMIFTFYNITNIFGWRLTIREINKAISASITRVNSDLENPDLKNKAILYQGGINILNSYFIKRPHFMRLVIIFVCSLIGLFFSIIGYSILSYSLYIGIIIVSEIIIAKWRIIRDNVLRPVNAELTELDHEKEI